MTPISNVLHTIWTVYESSGQHAEQLRAPVWLLMLLALPLAALLLHKRQLQPSKAVINHNHEATKETPQHLALPTSEQLQALMVSRRSVFPKDYNDVPVSREQIARLLEVANWAPTHGRTEPWRFVVLDAVERERMIETTYEALQESLPPEQFVMYKRKMDGKRTKTWPKMQWLIGIVMKRRALADKVMPEWEEIAACSCAVQNMALMASALGLAGYWTSWVGGSLDLPRFKEYMGCTEDGDRCLGFFVVANSDRIGDYRSKRGPVEQKTSWRVGRASVATAAE